jgi:hypothetical protein
LGRHEQAAVRATAAILRSMAAVAAGGDRLAD